MTERLANRLHFASFGAPVARLTLRLLEPQRQRLIPFAATLCVPLRVRDAQRLQFSDQTFGGFEFLCRWSEMFVALCWRFFVSRSNVVLQLKIEYSILVHAAKIGAGVSFSSSNMTPAKIAFRL